MTTAEDFRIPIVCKECLYLKDRAETEQRTLELLNDVRKKWTRAEEERMEKVKGELGQTKEAAAEFESQYRSCASELKKCKGDLEAVTNVKVQLKNKLKDYKQRLENVAKEEDKRAQVFSPAGVLSGFVTFTSTFFFRKSRAWKVRKWS